MPILNRFLTNFGLFLGLNLTSDLTSNICTQSQHIWKGPLRGKEPLHYQPYLLNYLLDFNNLGHFRTLLEWAKTW